MDEYKLESPDDAAWGNFFADELERERWQTNFGKDSEAAENAAYWRDMVPNIEPSVAAIYHKNGLNVYNVQDYHQAGINDYQEVLGWHRVKAQPEVATSFKEKGVDPATYEKWSKIGVQDADTMIRFADDLKLDVTELEKYIQPLLTSGDLDLNSLPQWLDAGVNLREIKNWLDAGFKYASVVKAWKSLRMNPEDAAAWQKIVIRPAVAANWIGAGYHDLKDVEAFLKQGYNSPEEIEREAEDVVIKGV